jgi:hypothetical protein
MYREPKGTCSIHKTASILNRLFPSNPLEFFHCILPYLLHHRRIPELNQEIFHLGVLNSLHLSLESIHRFHISHVVTRAYKVSSSEYRPLARMHSTNFAIARLTR